MDNFRREVRVFVRAAEMMLAPASHTFPLTLEEREIVSFYAHNLLDRMELDWLEPSSN
jgi:hypothetical protein